MFLLVGNEVVVGRCNGRRGFGCAFEAVCCFATGEVDVLVCVNACVILQRRQVKQRAHFERTCVMRAGSWPAAHASMRAWRFEPLPEMSTVRLYRGSDMMA